ncbi:hypothetical protein DH2020_030403 [Rehmannia glutinosa]|uniref:Uncharacterized protein n=1 Tax=Rehmannia glutinosa TaxID=99300 RepID=A0ABR0VNF5_REHGL
MIAIVGSFLPSPNILRPCNLWGNLRNKRREFPLSALASTSWQQNVDSFRECGVTFSNVGDSYVVRLALDNGSAAKLILPNGLITSFKAQMWHGATMELLHTTVSTSENGGGGAVIQGGLSLALAFENDAGVSWSPNAWALHRVNGTPQDSIQVELISTSEEGINTQVKHIITLRPDLLTSEVLVSNLSTSSLRLTGSAICHLTVSTPDATYALGLQGSDFFIRPPFVPNSSIIIPPDFDTSGQDPSKSSAFDKLFTIWDARNAKNDVESMAKDIKEELEGEEDDNYKHLTEKLSRIYTSAPRSLTIIDRGRRNSVAVNRNGFKELYMFSPGSEHEWYNKYSYICIGHSALIEPIILNAQSEWRGGLQLLNPNF